MVGVFKWAQRRGSEPVPAAVPPAPLYTTTSSKVLPRFLTAVSQQEAPVLLDLGAVVGANVGFFGDRLGCKIYVEDLFAEVEKEKGA